MANKQNIEDKQIWSAAKKWYNSQDNPVRWEDLSGADRFHKRQEYLRQLKK